MKLEVLNKTSYEKIDVICNGKSVILQAEENAPFEIGNGCRLEVFVLEKNMVVIDLFNAFFDGYISEESVVNSINCTAEFNLMFTDANDTETIVIEDMQAIDDIKRWTYNSVFLKNQNLSVLDSVYHFEDIEKDKKKSVFYQSVVCSGVPMLLFCLVMAVILKDIIILIPFLIILVGFSIPSWKKTAKLKTYYSNENANKQLKHKEIELREKEKFPEVEKSSESIKTKVINFIKTFFGIAK